MYTKVKKRVSIFAQLTGGCSTPSFSAMSNGATDFLAGLMVANRLYCNCSGASFFAAAKLLRKRLVFNDF